MELRQRKRLLRETKRFVTASSRKNMFISSYPQYHQHMNSRLSLYLNYHHVNMFSGRPYLLRFTVRIFCAVFFIDRLWNVSTARPLLFFRFSLACAFPTLALPFMHASRKSDPYARMKPRTTLPQTDCDRTSWGACRAIVEMLSV